MKPETKFWNVGEDNGIYEVEMWWGKGVFKICLQTTHDQKSVGKRLRIGQDYNVETRDTRKELTSYFEGAMNQKIYTCLRNY